MEEEGVEVLAEDYADLQVHTGSWPLRELQAVFETKTGHEAVQYLGAHNRQFFHFGVPKHPDAPEQDNKFAETDKVIGARASRRSHARRKSFDV